MDDARMQLGLLLRKNFLLRVRQPVILALELLWPIIIFLAIMGARWTIPPVDRPTCHYNAWALPTAGTVPFLQTLICNIDNDCLNSSQYQDIPNYPNSRIEELVSHVVPLLSDKKLKSFVEALPKGTKFARALLDTLSRHDLREIITKGIPVKAFLKDSNETQAFLSQYFPSNVTEPLLGSFIRLPQLLQFASASAAVQICNTSLQAFDDLVRPDAWSEALSGFCELDSAKQKQFFNELQSHLDVASIVHLVGDVMSQLGRVDVGKRISQLGSTLQSLSSKYLLPALFQGNLKPLLQDLWTILSDIHDGNLDFNLLSLVADDAEPLYEGSNWSLLKNSVEHLIHSKANCSGQACSTSVLRPSASPRTWRMRSNTSELNGNSLSKDHSNTTSSSNSAHMTETSATSVNLLQTFSDWIETLMYILRLLPEEEAARITGHKAFGMFHFIVNAVYEIMKLPPAQGFQDFFDLAESMFYTLADMKKGDLIYDASFWKTTLCNKTEFLENLNVPQGIDALSVQNFACNVTTLAEKFLQWWPSQKAVKPTSEKNPKISEMLGFLLSHQAKEVSHGSRNTIRSNLLQLQLAFGNFMENLRQKSNLTDSLMVLLRVTDTAFHQSTTGRKLVPLVAHFAQELTAQINHSIAGDIVTEEPLPVLASFIRSSVLAVIEVAESALWTSFEHPVLVKLTVGRENFCSAADNSTLYKILCPESSTFIGLKFPSDAVLQKISGKRKVDWISLRSNIEYLVSYMKNSSLHCTKSSYKPCIPPVLSATNSLLASMHLFLPKETCYFMPLVSNLPNSSLCYILQLQMVKDSMVSTTDELRNAVHLMEKNSSAFIWSALSMVAEQIFDLSIAEELEESKEEILTVLKGLRLSSQNPVDGEFDWENHVRLVFSIVKLVGSHLENEYQEVKSFFHTFHSVVNLLINRIQAIESSSAVDGAEKPVVSVEEVFPGAPVTQAVMKSLLPRLPDVLSTLFWTSLAQGKLHHMAAESHRNLTIVTKLLCNDTVTDFLYNPSFEGEERWESLMGEVCSHPYFKVFEELLEDPDIQVIIFESDSAEDPVEWKELEQGLMDLTSAILKLSRERKLDLSVLPSSSVVWSELWRNISQTAQKPPVIVYVLANSFFYRFCDHDVLQNGEMSLFSKEIRLPQSLFRTSNISMLSDTLCYMSTEDFAKISVNSWMELIHSNESHPLYKDWRNVYDTILTATNMRPILNGLLGDEGYSLFQAVDEHLLSKWNSSDVNSFNRWLISATKKAYSLADFISEQNFTESLFYSRVPFVLEKFINYAKSGGSLQLSTVIQNNTILEKMFSATLNQAAEVTIFRAWVAIQADYFGNANHKMDVAAICLENSTVDEVIPFSDASIAEFSKLFCENPPSEWVKLAEDTHFSSPKDMVQTFSRIMLTRLNEESQRNVSMFTKRHVVAYVKDLIESSANHLQNAELSLADWDAAQEPSTYFAVIRSIMQVAHANYRENFFKWNQSCTPTNWSLEWSVIPNNILDAIPDVEYVLCHLPSQNISHLYGEMSKLLGIRHLFSKFMKSPSAKWSTDCAEMEVPWIELSFKWMDSLLNLSERVVTQLVADSMDWKNLRTCAENLGGSQLLKDLNRFGNFTKRVARLLSQLKTSGSVQKSWKEVEQEFADFITPQLPAFSRISDFFNLTAMNYSFVNSSAIPSEYILKVLEKSSINLNWLSRQNFSTHSVKETLCSSPTNEKLRGIFQFPPHQDAVMDVLNFFCNGSGLEFLLSRMNTDFLNKTLREAQEREFNSGNWFRDLFASSSGIIDDVVHLIRVLRDIPLRAPTSFQEVVQIISKTTAFQEFFEGLNSIVMKLTNVFGGSPILDYLQQILNGLQSFQYLQRLDVFKFSVKVKELFLKDGQAEQVAEFLRAEHFLDELEIREFLDTDLDLSKVLDLQEEGAKDGMCEKALLMAKLSRTGSLQNFPQIFCNLFSNKNLQMSLDHTQDLLLSKFLRNVAELGFQGILQRADMGLKDTQETLHSLGHATEVMIDLESHLESLLSILDPHTRQQLVALNISHHGVSILGTPEALAASGRLLCGKPLKTIQRKFSLLTLSENREPTIDEKETRNLPNEFCRNAYKNILKMPGGAILWGFLKPLFRGKILYSPKDSYAAQAVITQVNTTFESVAEYIQLFQAMAEGTTGLHYLEKKRDLLHSVQMLLLSNPVKKLLGQEAIQISDALSSGGDWNAKLPKGRTMGTAVLELVTLVGNISQCITLNRFVGFDTEYEMEKAAAQLHSRREFIAAIVFINNEIMGPLNSGGKLLLPNHILYKIRMDIDNVPTAKEAKHRWWRPYPYDNFFDDFRYFRGFIQLQELIDSSILELQTLSHNATAPVPMKKFLQQIPYPCHQQDKFGTVLKGSLPGLMTVSWVFLIAFLVRDKVLEKELSLHEVLDVMGLHPALAWLSWFLTGLATCSVSVIGIVIIMKWGGITPLSNPVILFLFVFDFSILLISYCHLMSVLFKRAAAGALVAIVIYVLSFFPFLLYVTWELYFLFWHKVLTCLLVATSFCFSCLYLNRLEDQAQGVQWDNLWLSPIPDDSMNMGISLTCMAVCSAVYFIVAIYIEQSRTDGGESNKKFSWLPLHLPLAWNRKTSAAVPLCENQNEFSDIAGEIPKEYSTNDKESVSIKGLRVVYPGRLRNEAKEAVSNLNLSLCEGRITTLLGHNGAGKTTTIKVLTGRLQPTAGNVTIYNIPISERLSDARKLIGYCPQHNTLFGKLTVREHLVMFAQLKGVLSGPKLDDDVERMLECLGLKDKQHELTEKLSGGQKRRLCVGMAFVGGSRFIVLDEPTSSVDPLARRSIWDLIVQYKSGRTILLTTHHLDEADILSDEVAVLHRGKLLCSGSPLLLKGKFGSGYKLSLFATSGSLEGDDFDEEDSGNASVYSSEIGSRYHANTNLNRVDENALMEFIQSIVPSANLLERCGDCLVVSIPQLVGPVAQNYQPKSISHLFQELDGRFHSWGFKSYTLSSTSLEEVFLTLCQVEDTKSQYSSAKPNKTFSPPKVCSSAHHKRESKWNDEKRYYNGNDVVSYDPISNMKKYQENARLSVADYDLEPQDLLTGHHLKLSQFQCLLMKRLWHTKRNWKMVISGILMPCLFIALAMGLAVGRPARRPEPSIELAPRMYSSRTGTTVSFIGSNDWESSSMKPILDSLLASNGTLRSLCYDSGEGNECEFSIPYEESEEMCLCKERTQCTKSEKDLLPFIVRSGKAVFYNVSGQDLNQHLLRTFIRFNEKRYGGWTLASLQGDNINITMQNVEDILAKIWFDNSGYHAAPSYLNSFNDAMLKAAMHDVPNKGVNFGITAYSHPMQLSAEQLGQETLLQRLGEIGIAFVFLIGLSLIPSASSVYIVREVSLEEKQVQIAAGVSPILYWATHLVWDLVCLLMTAVLASTVIYLFALPPFVHRLNFSAVITLLLSFGWASIPLMYMCSRFFKEGSLAFMVLFTTNLFVGLIVLLVVISLHMLNISTDAEQVLQTVKKVSLVFPQWSLLGGLTALTQNQLQSDIFQLFGQDTYENPFGWSLLLPNYIALLVEGTVFFALNIAVEIGFVAACMNWFRKWVLFQTIQDGEIKDEKSEDIVKLQNVCQIYQTQIGINYAVKSVSMKISRGECFGLVGANGAGKTTLFRMLSGQLTPSSGSIRIGEYSGRKVSKASGYLGYCPQKDALDELLTPREHLTLYAQLKGIHHSCIHEVVEQALKSFDLSGHSECSVRSLSGGTKRKLCTAIAMIGSPSVVLLDEPTSGMDPGSRRLVWNSIMHITTKKQKAAVILSSHSIEECDVLCSRIGIMVNGQILCTGTPHELKNKYGSGITISFRAPHEDHHYSSAVVSFIKERFPSAQFKARHCNTFEFSVPSKVPLAEVFEHLEDGTVKYGFQDIALNHTTLDQVFVGFVRQQSDETLEESPVKSVEDGGRSLEMAAFPNFAYCGSNGDLSIDKAQSSSLQFATRL